MTQKTESQDGELCHPKGFKLFSGPIINKPYACPHGRLDPVHARSMKVSQDRNVRKRKDSKMETSMGRVRNDHKL